MSYTKNTLKKKKKALEEGNFGGGLGGGGVFFDASIFGEGSKSHSLPLLFFFLFLLSGDSSCTPVPHLRPSQCGQVFLDELPVSLFPCWIPYTMPGQHLSRPTLANA